MEISYNQLFDISSLNFKNIERILNNLGRLEKNLDKKPLLDLERHEKASIRSLAVKNLAKFEDIELIDNYLELIKNDESNKVRREATSAIGRLRDKRIIPILSKLLDDDDPEIVLQAIRGLLTFKSDSDVKQKLSQLQHHPNEIVRDVINNELFFIETVKQLTTKHIESPQCIKNTVIEGDVREILKKIPDESLHLTFTSPPYYNARDYSIYKSYEQYLDFLEEVFKEIHRVTKEGRFFVLNTSPIIIPRFSRAYASKRYPIPYDLHCRLVSNGWEFIDDIVWAKPEYSVKNRNAGFLQHRKPLAYKPNARSECVMVYRKKTNKLIDWNISQYPKDIVEKSKINGDYEKNNIWEIDPAFDKTHSAVFPIELCNKVIKFYSFIGDLVFDPFAGSGTVGKAAEKLGRYYFLTEISNKYTKRMQETLEQNNLSTKIEYPPRFIKSKDFTFTR